MTSRHEVEAPTLLGWIRSDPFRIAESALLQGTPFFGFVFAANQWPTQLHQALLPLLGSFLITNSVFMVNDVVDQEADRLSRHRDLQNRLTWQLGRGRLSAIAALEALLGLVLVGTGGAMPALYGACVVAAGLLYSVPPVRTKIRPVYSSLTHVVGAIAHFMIGYSILGDDAERGLLLSLFMSGIFMAGHLVQEIRDHADDLQSGLATNAVRFGPARVFRFSWILFVASIGYVTLLAARGIAPPVLAASLLVLPIHLYTARGPLAAGFSRESVMAFQRVYRLTFVGLGVLWAIALA